MDLGRIKAHGTSTTHKAWITNPVRSLLWRLIAPYFQGFVIEIDQRQHAESNSLRQESSALREHVMSTLNSHLASARTDASALQQEITTNFASHLASARTDASALQQEITTNFASQLAGARKDAMAVGYRIAGLEEEAGANKQARMMLEENLGKTSTEVHEAAAYVSSLHEEVRSSVETLRERIESAAAEGHEAAAYVASLHEEVRSSVETLQEKTASAAAEGHEAAAYVASLHEEVRSLVKTLNERIDSLARGESLRSGDRISVGQDDLVLVATALKTRFLVSQHDLIGRLVADGKEWEPHVRRAIERLAQPDGIAVDAGAYIGLHTVSMSRSFRSVHAFEPQRGIYQVLNGNLALNGCTNVTAHNVALYDRAGAMRLSPEERQEVPTPMLDGQPDYAQISNAAALTFEVADSGSGEVRAVPLDDLALEGVALIKVDTQGADLRVLRGAEGTIRRCRPSILFEWERDLSIQHGATLEDYHKFFSGLDYDLTVLQETSPGRQADYLATPR
jgi:FkbM family methyltransferase